MMRSREMGFFVSRADVELQMIVANAAHDVSAECVPAKFSALVAVHESDFAAGPGQGCFFESHRFNRRIILAVFWIFHRPGNRVVAFLTRFRSDESGRKIADRRRTHSAKRSRPWKMAAQVFRHPQIAKQLGGIDAGEKLRAIKSEDRIEISSANALSRKSCGNNQADDRNRTFHYPGIDNRNRVTASGIFHFRAFNHLSGRRLQLIFGPR